MTEAYIFVEFKIDSWDTAPLWKWMNSNLPNYQPRISIYNGSIVKVRFSEIQKEEAALLKLFFG